MTYSEQKSRNNMIDYRRNKQSFYLPPSTFYLSPYKQRFQSLISQAYSEAKKHRAYAKNR